MVLLPPAIQDNNIISYIGIVWMKIVTFLIQNDDKDNNNRNYYSKNSSKDDPKHYSKCTLMGVYKDKNFKI